jgi:guanine deaminase
MCMGAIYWARPEKVFYACTREDAAEVEFDDQFIYEELGEKTENRKIDFKNLMRHEALPLFKQWKNKPDRIPY